MSHRTRVEADRFRVVCIECPWFWVRLGASKDDLWAMGRAHQSATRGTNTEEN